MTFTCRVIMRNYETTFAIVDFFEDGDVGWFASDMHRKLSWISDRIILHTTGRTEFARVFRRPTVTFLSHGTRWEK
jgi:hypothetical protein